VSEAVAEAEKYRCHSCDLRFEAEPGGRLRCPSCMRVSTVEVDAGRGTKNSGRTLWRAALAVALLAACGIGGYFALSRPTLTADSEREAPVLDSLHVSEEWSELAQRLLGTSPRDAFAQLSRGVVSELALHRLVLVPVASSHRAFVYATEQHRELLESLVNEEGAYLFPIELTLALATLLDQTDLDYDFVLLPPEEETLRSEPLLALRDPSSGLALDPRDGQLRPAARLTTTARLKDDAVRTTFGRVALRDHNLPALKEWYAKSQAALPDSAKDVDWRTRAFMAEAALALALPQEAAKWAEDLKRDSNHPDGWLVAARVRQALKPAPDAWIADLRELVMAFPFEAELCAKLGELLYTQGDYDAAHDAYLLALERDDNVIGARTGLANLYTTGDSEYALRLLKAELDRDPAYVEAYLGLVTVYTFLNRPSDVDRVVRAGRLVAEDKEAFENRLTQTLAAARALNEP